MIRHKSAAPRAASMKDDTSWFLRRHRSSFCCIVSQTKKVKAPVLAIELKEKKNHNNARVPRPYVHLTANNETIDPNSLRRHINFCLVLERDKQCRTIDCTLRGPQLGHMILLVPSQSSTFYSTTVHHPTFSVFLYSILF